MSVHRFLIVLTLGLSGISAVMAQPSAPTPAARQSSFPPVGLAFSETMQVNLSNQAANPTSGTAASCTGTVTFLDSSGKEISKSGGTFTVPAWRHAIHQPAGHCGRFERGIARGDPGGDFADRNAGDALFIGAIARNIRFEHGRHACLHHR